MKDPFVIHISDAQRAVATRLNNGGGEQTDVATKEDNLHHL